MFKHRTVPVYDMLMTFPVHIDHLCMLTQHTLVKQYYKYFNKRVRIAFYKKKKRKCTEGSFSFFLESVIVYGYAHFRINSTLNGAPKVTGIMLNVSHTMRLSVSFNNLSHHHGITNPSDRLPFLAKL